MHFKTKNNSSLVSQTNNFFHSSYSPKPPYKHLQQYLITDKTTITFSNITLLNKEPNYMHQQHQSPITNVHLCFYKTPLIYQYWSLIHPWCITPLCITPHQKIWTSHQPLIHTHMFLQHMNFATHIMLLKDSRLIFLELDFSYLSFKTFHVPLIFSFDMFN